MSKKKPRQEPETLGLPAGGVETHAHLDIEPLNQDVDAAVQRAKACGVDSIGQVFLSPRAYAAGRALFDEHPGVFFLLGMHPHEARDVDQGVLDAMREAFESDPRLKALGEIGLDYYYDHSPRDVQRRAFARQLELAREVNRPVVIHCRDAWDDCMEILGEGGFKDYPLLWHCFGGDTQAMQNIVDNGWLLSIPGPVTYRKNEAMQQAVAAAPLDRLVLETDSPFLAPEPWRGKPNQPAYLGFTAATVAQLRGMAVAELWQATADNARRFFGI